MSCPFRLVNSSMVSSGVGGAVSGTWMLEARVGILRKQEWESVAEGENRK